MRPTHGSRSAAGSGGQYAQIAKLVASDAAALDQFGWSVAIDGNTVVVGLRRRRRRVGLGLRLRTSDGGATYVEVAKLTVPALPRATTSAGPWPSTAPPSRSGPYTTTTASATGLSLRALPHDRWRRNVQPGGQAGGHRRRGQRLLRHPRGDRRGHPGDWRIRRLLLHGRSLRLPPDHGAVMLKWPS